MAGASDEAVVAAAEALLAAGFVDPDDGTIPQWLSDGNPAPVWTHPSEAVKVALDAAQPFMGATPVASREQLAHAHHRYYCIKPEREQCDTIDQDDLDWADLFIDEIRPRLGGAK